MHISHGELICSRSQPLISYKCWDIRTIHQTDIIGETRGEIFCLFHCLEDTGFVFDDPRETGKESSCVCFVFTFSRHMERRTRCFALWTYSEYEPNHIALLDQLMYVNIEIYKVCSG